MPANLTPEYDKAEQRYREAGTDQEKLLGLQEMLSKIPKHKGTDHMQADIKRKISLLRKDIAKKGPSKGGPDPFHVPKTGAGQVVLIGPPNVGKSALVATCTNASVKVAEYPYTTAVPAPGMLEYEGVQIQLVDTPPLTPEHVPAGLMGTINFADVIAVVIDAAADPLEQADATLALLAERGLELRPVPRGQLDPDAHRQCSAVLLANKADLARSEDLDLLAELYAGRIDVLPVSAATGNGLDRLAGHLWKLLDLIRVYTKEPGRPIDHDRPYTLPPQATIQDLAHEIHRDLPAKIKFARIWGAGRFDGQRAHRSEVLHDKDVVEIHQ